jgi:hypothetical protein
MNSKMSISQLLFEIAAGHSCAVDVLMSLINDELRMTLVRRLTPDDENNRIDVVDLVNQIYSKLVKKDFRLTSVHRITFYSLAAQSIRLILVNFSQNYLHKTDCKVKPFITLNAVEFAREMSPEKFLIFQEALEELTRQNGEQGTVAEKRLFAGLSVSDIAELTGKAPEKVAADWQAARVWLANQISKKSA